MRAEIIAIGTELLLGQIVNTNAQFLSEELAQLGVNVFFQTVVGDNESRLTEALQIASSRADLILCTGGLGPTQDDITKDVLAKHIGVELGSDEQALSRIESYFRERNLTMVESNARQASLPVGADPLPNDNGMAVGAAISVDGAHYILLPGPPRELKLMFSRHAKKWIAQQLGKVNPLYSKMMRFAGIGESSLENALLDLIKQQQQVTIAPYAKDGEVLVRITVRAESEHEAEKLMEPTCQSIRDRVGDYLYAEKDLPLEHVLVRMLDKRGFTLSVAESASGGLLAETITAVAGSSRVFCGGVVAYSPDMKQQFLQVHKKTIETDGTISEACASEMAENVRRLTGSDVSLSITGVAGPESSEGKPVGLVYVALAHKDGVKVRQLNLGSDREGNRLRAVKYALYELWSWLREPQS